MCKNWQDASSYAFATLRTEFRKPRSNSQQVCQYAPCGDQSNRMLWHGICIHLCTRSLLLDRSKQGRFRTPMSQYNRWICLSVSASYSSWFRWWYIIIKMIVLVMIIISDNDVTISYFHDVLWFQTAGVPRCVHVALGYWWIKFKLTLNAEVVKQKQLVCRIESWCWTSKTQSFSFFGKIARTS